MDAPQRSTLTPLQGGLPTGCPTMARHGVRLDLRGNMDNNTQAAVSVSAAQAFTDSSGLTYSAQFVPQSQSRNAGDKQPSINWRVTISKGNAILTTDYTQGCAHLPHYSQQFSKLAVYDDAVRHACETGKSTWAV